MIIHSFSQLHDASLKIQLDLSSVVLKFYGMERLLEYLNAERGRRRALAEALGVGPSSLSMWKRVPAERVLDVERLTGIDRRELRPDLFGSMGDQS